MNETHFKGWAKPGPVPPGLAAVGDEGVAATETLDAISGHFRLFQLRDGHRFSTDDILTAWYGARPGRPPRAPHSTSAAASAAPSA